jgi:hypothetical protein
MRAVDGYLVFDPSAVGARSLPTHVATRFPHADEVETGDEDARRTLDRYGLVGMLTDQEKAWGCVRPYRHTFRHTICGSVQPIRFAEMALAIARDPAGHMINRKGVFCRGCGELVPAAEAVWVDADGREVGKVGG